MFNILGQNHTCCISWLHCAVDVVRFGVPVPKRGYILVAKDSASIDTSTGGGALQFARSVVLNSTTSGEPSAPRLILEEDIDRLDEVHWGDGNQMIGLRFYLTPKGT